MPGTNKRPDSAIACTTPFRKIEILPGGGITMCCYSWLPKYCGNFLTDSIPDILNNLTRLEIQDGMRKGRFTHCTDHCPYLNSYRNTDEPLENLWPLVPIDSLDDKLAKQKYMVFFTYDDSCNLQCPSCRYGLILHKQGDHGYQELSMIHEKAKRLVDELSAQGHDVHIHMTGSGDPFASPLFWSYLRELANGEPNPRLSIGLSTNGVLMTPNMMEQIRGLWPNITNISISIDAATEDTYKKVRKGGNFDRLKSNLDKLDEMIGRGDLPNLDHWQTNFIVQRDNFKELKSFMEWQLGYRNLHTIWTNRIAQWGHISDADYNDMAIWRDGNPMRDELVEILSDPIFQDPRIFLGNMNSLS